MQRTSVWTTSRAIFVVLCLLASGCQQPTPAEAHDIVPGQALAPLGPVPPPVVLDEGDKAEDRSERDKPEPEMSFAAGPPEPVLASAPSVSTKRKTKKADEKSHTHAKGTDPDHKHPDTYKGQAPVVMEQRKATKRASVKTTKLDDNVDDLALAIRQQRFARLAMYAAKFGWNVMGPPENANMDERVMGWWREWRVLKAEMERIGPPPPPSPSKLLQRLGPKRAK